MNSIETARAVFDEYAAIGADEIPRFPMSALQVRLARWQNANFGGATAEQIALGVAEEAGELCHAVLKASQRIRGMDDPEKVREAVGDAIADVAIYAMQMATLYRLDFETLVTATAGEVMQRDWTKAPTTGTAKLAPACAACGGELGKKWWQDVPGRGDLCDPCHVMATP